MKLRSPAREFTAIAVVGAVLLGAQALAHVFLPPDDAPDVWLGGMVKPGMAEPAVRRVLNERYELVNAGGEKYDLRVKDGLGPWTGGGVSSERTLGAVWFHHGKLTRLSHDVYRSDAGRGDPADLAGAVHAAVAVASLGHEQPCEVSTETRKSSTAEVNETDISCGRRMVRIVMSRAPGAPGAQLEVSEEIR